MATLGFEITDRTISCAINTNGTDTLPVGASDGAQVIGLSAAITPAGPVFGNAAQRAIHVQPELPCIHELLSEDVQSKQWYQDANDKHWRTAELLQTLVAQVMTSARDIAFERNWQVTMAVETECHDQIEQWLNSQPQVADYSIQALVCRQTALAAYWSSKHPVQQTVITIDWAPRQIHLGVFTCSGGSFKLLGTRSISNVGLNALEEVLANALLAETIDQRSSFDANGRLTPEVKLALCKLWQQALSAPTGVGKQECWIGDELAELILLKEHLQELARPFCQQVMQELLELLKQVGLKSGDADRVVLFGGPSDVMRTELVLRNQFGAEAIVVVTEASAMSQGAAMLSGFTPSRLQDVLKVEEALNVRVTSASARSMPIDCINDCDIGLRIGNPARGKAMIYKLIDAKSDLPVRRSRVFRTSRPNQNRLILDLVYVEPATGRVVQQETRSLQLPADLPAYTPIEVTVTRHARRQGDALPAACSVDAKLTSMVEHPEPTGASPR